MSLEYTADFVPVAVLSPPLPSQHSTAPGGGTACRSPDGCAFIAASAFPSGSAVAVGASPFGLTAVIWPSHRLQPTIAATGGLLWSDRPVPTTAAARLNFVATAEAGVRLLLQPDLSVTVTYRFHHLSNAGLARDNYALASNIFSLGMRWRRG